MNRSYLRGNSDFEWMRAEVNRVLAEAIPGRWRPDRGSVWRPPTDVYETDDSVVVIVEVAGLKEGDYEITLTNRTLTVKGQRRDPADKLAYHQMEINYGEFRTQVYLPWPLEDTDEGVEATYEDGFLRVVLRKAQPRRIPVRQRCDEGE